MKCLKMQQRRYRSVKSIFPTKAKSFYSSTWFDGGKQRSRKQLSFWQFFLRIFLNQYVICQLLLMLLFTATMRIFYAWFHRWIISHLNGFLPDSVKITSHLHVYSLRSRRSKGKRKGNFGREKKARGARGERKGNACKEAIVFHVINIH